MLLFFFFFCVIFNNFFITSVAKENTRVKDALANPAGTPITLVKKYLSLQMLQIKQLKSCQYNQKQ